MILLWISNEVFTSPVIPTLTLITTYTVISIIVDFFLALNRGFHSRDSRKYPQGPVSP